MKRSFWVWKREKERAVKTAEDLIKSFNYRPTKNRGNKVLWKASFWDLFRRKNGLFHRCFISFVIVRDLESYIGCITKGEIKVRIKVCKHIPEAEKIAIILFSKLDNAGFISSRP